MGEKEALERVLGGMKGEAGEGARLGRELERVQMRVLGGVNRLILHGAITIPDHPSNFTSLLPSLRPTSPLPPESQIRLHRLKEATQLKHELQQKISFLSESIHLLSHSAEPTHPKKPRLLDSSLEAQKRDESTEFVRRLVRERRARQARKELYVSRMVEEVEKRVEAQRGGRMELETRFISERENRLKSLRDKAIQREAYISHLKTSLKQSSITPEAKVTPLLPDLPSVKRCEHPLKRHFTLDEMKAHLKRYSEERQERSVRRARFVAEQRLTTEVHQTIHSRNYTEALQSTKAQREAAARKATERRLALAKQRRYSELVKEMYTPAIDSKKAAEVEQKKARFSDTKSTPVSDQDPPHAKPPVPKFKHGERKDETPVIRSERKAQIDYLDLQRKPQSDLNLKALAELQVYKLELQQDLMEIDGNLEEKQDKIRAKVAIIEAKTRKNEAILSRISAMEKGGLEIEAGVNDVLIASIKAKLALLQS